jgi:hypothetical protein
MDSQNESTFLQISYTIPASLILIQNTNLKRDTIFVERTLPDQLQKMENNKLETEYSSQVYLQLNNVAEFIVKRNVMPEKAVVYSHAFITGKNSSQKDG